MNKKTVENLLRVKKIKEQFDSAQEFENQLRENPMTEGQFGEYVMKSDMTAEERSEMINQELPHLRRKGLVVEDTPPTFQEFRKQVKREDPKMSTFRQSVINQMTREEFDKLNTVRYTPFNDSNREHHAYEYIDRDGIQKTAGTRHGINSKYDDGRIIDLRTADDTQRQMINDSISESNKARLEIPSYLREIEENRNNLHSFAPVKHEVVE